MDDYIEEIEPIALTRSRRKLQEASCNFEELRIIQKIAGPLNYLGHGILPPAWLFASRLQQFVGNLKVSHLFIANNALRSLKRLSPSLCYQSTANKLDLCDSNVSVFAFSDASTGNTPYGQTCYISGLLLPTGGKNAFHVLDWHSSKQSRVSFSSVGADILAAAESADRSILLKDRLKNILQIFLLTMVVESFEIYSTLTTLHEGRDYRLRPNVSWIRDSFNSGELNYLHWIPGESNIADAFTKIKTDMLTRLNDAMLSGVLHRDMLSTSYKSIGRDTQ